VRVCGRVFCSPIRRGTLSGVVLRRTSGLRVHANLVVVRVKTWWLADCRVMCRVMCRETLKHFNYRSLALPRPDPNGDN
jgi:hypothetical protein